MKAVLGAPSEAPADSKDTPLAADGGAEQGARQESLSDDREITENVEKKPVPEAKAEDQVETEVESDDAQSEDWQPTTLEELAEGLGWDSEKLFGLPAKTKIDGKEGTATLRDLVKSYQLDGHLHQKLSALDTDRKALLADREKFNSERADKLLKLDAGVKTLERLMYQEFQSVDWQKLASESPDAYNSKLVQFQQRNAELQGIAGQIAQEQQAQQAQQTEAAKAYLAEQKKLLDAKVPEWADESVRAKDKAEILSYLDSVGITKEEFEAVVDHRHALVIRDAWKWHQLQKQKTTTMNKVKAAPKLLKPGSQQSKDVVARIAMTKGRDRLRQTGKVADAVPLVKRALFG